MPAPRRSSLAAAAALLSVLFLSTALTGCSPSGTPATGATGDNRPTPTIGAQLTDTEAALAYGLGPTRDPSVTYQPDVVIVEGGPSIIRWASDDGLTWAIDRKAPGAADLEVGSVMFATSVAVGRVAAIDDQGEDRIVTIAPIDLTELIRNADIEIDEDLDLRAAAYHELPADYPSTITEADDAPASPEPSTGPEPTGGAEIITLPPIRLVAARAGNPTDAATADGKLTVPGKVCPKLGIGAWGVEYCMQGEGLNLAIEYKALDHLKLGVTVKLLASKLRFHAGTVIKDGQMIDSGGLLDGLEGFELNIAGGVEDGAQDNVKVKAEVPVEIETGSIVVGGIPLKMYVEAKFTVEMALSGKNSTLSGDGRYALSGPIGIVDGKPVSPTLTTVSSIIDSLRGVTVGPSGIVFAVKWKVQGGVGLYGFVAGPYVTVTMSMGIGQGSVIGAPLAECRGASLGMWVGAGGGYNLNASKMKWLFGKDSLLVKYLKLKQDIDLLQFQTFDKQVVTPDVPLCRG